MRISIIAKIVMICAFCMSDICSLFCTDWFCYWWVGGIRGGSLL